jgi:hypothetical protein
MEEPRNSTEERHTGRYKQQSRHDCCLESKNEMQDLRSPGMIMEPPHGNRAEAPKAEPIWVSQARK